MLGICLVLYTLPSCPTKGLCTLAFPPEIKDRACGSMSSSAFGVISVSDFDCSNSCVVRIHRYFNLEFSNDLGCCVSFHMFTWHLCDEMSIKIFYPFSLIKSFIFLVSFKSLFVYVCNSPLSDISFANICSEPMSSVFILLTLSFTDQKFNLFFVSCNFSFNM